VYAYLEWHREHINYAMYKELSLPLDSGSRTSGLRINHPAQFIAVCRRV